MNNLTWIVLDRNSYFDLDYFIALRATEYVDKNVSFCEMNNRELEL